MKTFLTLLISALSVLAFAQRGTTLNEYDYIKNIYKTQSYKSFKNSNSSKEYYVKDLYFWKSEQVKIAIQGLFIVENKDLRGLMVTILEKKTVLTHIGIPNPYSQDSLIKDYQKELLQLTSEQLVAFNLAYSEYNQKLISRSFALEDANSRIRNAQSSSSKTYSAQGDRGAVNRPSKQKTSTNSSSQNGVSINIKGGIQDRKILQFSTPNNENNQFGTVTIKVCVNPDGKVLEARYTQKGSTTSSNKLINLATESSKKMQFEVNSDAPDKQCGIIVFKFLPH